MNIINKLLITKISYNDTSEFLLSSIFEFVWNIRNLSAKTAW